MIVCSPQLGLSPDSILGGEVFDREILLGLARNNIQVEIVLPKDKAHDRSIRNWRFSYVFVSHFPALFFNLLVIPYLFRIQAKNNIDIIRMHQPQFMGYGCIFFKLFFPKVKLVATYHQFGETSYGSLSQYLNNFWDHIICDSFNVKEKIHTAFHVPQDKITVVHNGVPNYLKPSPKNAHLVKKYNLENKKVLMFMGLFIERKNPLFLLDVLKKVHASTPNAVIVFIGKGPLLSMILENAGKLGLSDAIRIADPVFGEEKKDLLNCADIFVHPARDEGFALAPLEAMACGIPILMGTGHSATEAINEGENGYICKVDNVEQWSEKVISLLSDNNLRTKMSKAALRHVKEKFQWSIAVDKHIQVFKNLLHED